MKHILFLTKIFSLLVFINFHLFSQTITVVDKTNLQPITSVKIYNVSEPDKSVTTNIKGLNRRRRVSEANTEAQVQLGPSAARAAA